MSPGSPDHENTSDTRVASGTRCRDYDGEIDMFLSLWWINRYKTPHTAENMGFSVADWSQVFATLFLTCFYAVFCSKSFYL